MLDTRLMAMMTAHARDAGAKLILVGDDRQLSSIDRGGMFARAERPARRGRAGAGPAAIQARRAARSRDDGRGKFRRRLDDLQRQGRDPWTRTNAKPAPSWSRNGRPTRPRHRKNPAKSIAYRNDDVNQLNIALRAVRKQRGELEWEDHALRPPTAASHFAAGDRIQFTGTDKQAGIVNGATGTIEAIDGTHLAVAARRGRGQDDQFRRGDFRQIPPRPMPARSTPARDRTLDQTYLYHAEGWRSAPAYVALTRHREKTELFVARNTAADVKELARQIGRTDGTRAASMFETHQPIGPVRPMNAAEILTQFAGDDFTRTAERMEREGRPWPARDHQPVYRQDNEPPAGLELTSS